MPTTTQCPECGTPVECGPAAGREHCWCFDLPHVCTVDPQARCLCRACLEKKIEWELENRQPPADDTASTTHHLPRDDAS